MKGSSPLARGTLDLVGRLLVAAGLIPARAGNTVQVLQFIARTGGSSPLARGTLTGTLSIVLLEGLIPARAGNTQNQFDKEK